MKTLTINSYPRSGSALLQHMLQTMYPSVKVLELTGSLFDFSNFNPTNQGVICIIRNPIDSISNTYFKAKMDNSFYLNLNDPLHLEKIEVKKELSDFVEDYANFYKNILDNKQNIALLTFENVGIATYTSEAIKLKFNLDEEVVISRQDALNYVKKQYGTRIKPTEQEIEDLSTKIEENLQYSQCLSLYNALKNSAIN